MTRGFRHGHIFVISAVDAGDHGVPPGVGGHCVEGVVTLPGEAHGVRLDHEVAWELAVHHLLVKLLIRRQGGNWAL